MWKDSKIDFFTNIWQKKIYFQKEMFDKKYLSPLNPDFFKNLLNRKNVIARKKNKVHLIHHVELFSKRVQKIQQNFDFIPHWRFDDCMMSLSPLNGGVGNHKDYYDVFLVQVYGKKKWIVGKNKEEFICDVGDVLYIPPNQFHDGIALDHDSITLSVGFRSPSIGEMVTMMLTDLDEQKILSNESIRYKDNATKKDFNTRDVLTDQHINKLKKILIQQILKKDSLIKWFGCLMTMPKRWPQKITKSLDFSRITLSKDEQKEYASWKKEKGQYFIWNPRIKKIFYLNSYHEEGQNLLFLDGNIFYLPHSRDALLLQELISRKKIVLGNESTLCEKVLYYLIKWKVLNSRIIFQK